MATAHSNFNDDTEDEDCPSKLAIRTSEHEHDLANGASFMKTITTEPQENTWLIVAAGSIVPLGLAAAALTATYVTAHKQVALAAWIAVSVVGTASVISSAAVSHRRVVSIDRDRRKLKGNDNRNENSEPRLHSTRTSL